jgi:hypothetical protein
VVQKLVPSLDNQAFEEGAVSNCGAFGLARSSISGAISSLGAANNSGVNAVKGQRRGIVRIPLFCWSDVCRLTSGWSSSFFGLVPESNNPSAAVNETVNVGQAH